MTDRFPKPFGFRSTPTPLFGEPSSKPIKAKRDPPLRKVYYPPSEEFGPAFDIPELVPPKSRLPPLESLQLCDVDYDGDKEVVTLPRKPRPRANHRERAAKREEKKRTIQKQNKPARDESTPDIDHFVRQLCGDLPPADPFKTQQILPRVMKKITDIHSIPEEKCVVKKDKVGKRNKKDKSKKEAANYQSVSCHGENKQSEKSVEGQRKKKQKKGTKKTKMLNPTPVPPVVSPDLSSILKEIEDVYQAHEKNLGSSASKTNSTAKQDPLTAFQNRILALEDTVKGDNVSRQPLQETAPYPEIIRQSSPNINLEENFSREPLRGITPHPEVSRKPSGEINLAKNFYRQPLRGITPNPEIIPKPSPDIDLEKNLSRQPLRGITPHPGIIRKSGAEINLEKNFSRQPLRAITPYPELTRKPSAEINLEKNLTRQPLRGITPNPEITRKPSVEMNLDKNFTRQPLRGITPYPEISRKSSTEINLEKKFNRKPLRGITPYPEIIRETSPEVDLTKEVTFSFDINEEEEESLTYAQSIPFMAPTSQPPRKPLVSEPTRLGLLPKPPAFPKPPSTTRGGAQIGFRRRRYQAGLLKKHI